MKIKTRISIIIPVYNVEKYIEECVNSILFQQIKDCEIILVDDGSTDKSGFICDELREKYNNIKVIHQENRGLSGARNSGIKLATGEYLMFVDSDDYINKDVSLNKIIDNLKEDVIQYKWVYFYEKTKKYIYFKDHNTYEDLKDIKQVLRNKVLEGSISISACDKFIKRSVLIDNNMFFKEGIVSEDLEWSLRLYLCINSIKTINENIYIYRQQRTGSITNKLRKNNIDSLFNIIKYWYFYNYDNDVIKNAYLSYLAYHYIILLTAINKSNCSDIRKKEIYDLIKILNYSENRKVKICKKLFRICGYKIGIKILKVYINMKNKGLIKL